MSGFLKILDVGSFFEDVRNFDILPAALVEPAAIVVVAGEVLFGFALVVGHRKRIASFALAVMTGTFSIAIAVCYVRGISIECGCFGSVFRDRIDLGALLRDVMLMAGCLWLATGPEERIPTNEPLARRGTKSEQ